MNSGNVAHPLREGVGSEGPSARVIDDRYQLGEVLGAGGMAEVRSALDTRLDREVAIKLLDEHLAGSDRGHVRFEAEARACAALAHPNIVAVFDFGIDETTERPFLVMERLPGSTLADEIVRGPLDEQRVVQLGIQVADGLEAAHSAGIVHRDVKPANVLDAGDGTWKVADFGIAKTADAVDGLTTAGATMCTAGYVAPERLVGEPASPRSDLYSLGVVLYEALTGRRPFIADTPLGVAHLARTTDPVNLEVARPGVSPALTQIVHRALERDPSRRFKSARAMRSELARLPDRGTSSDSTVMTVPLDAGGNTRTRRLPTMRVPSVRPDSKRSRQILTVVAAVGAVVLLALMTLSGGDPAVPSNAPFSTVVTTSPPLPPSGAPSGVPQELDDALERLEEAVKP